jgi:uncharacterized SAM-binding protein YcdF (DUF218 family)
MSKKRMLIEVSIIALLSVILHAHWLALIGRFLIVADPLQPADAIVPLGGEAAQERLAYASKLFKQDYAQSFIIVNEDVKLLGIRTDYNELAKREARRLRVPEESIVLAPGVVTSTVDEAFSTRQLAEIEGFRSLIVVTSPFHTRRTRRIFRDVFRDTAITIVVRPVVGHWYEADSSRASADGLRTTWTEYLKFILYLGGYR